MVGPGQGEDPAHEYEQKEKDAFIAESIVRYVLFSLPLRQRYAMLCDLKKKVPDVLPLIEAFLKYGVDLESVECPTDKGEQARLRALLCIARKKLQIYIVELRKTF